MAAALSAVVVIASGSAAPASARQASGDKLLIVIAHTSFGTAGGFWATIKNGAEKAGKDFAGYGVRVEFAALEREDPSQMGALIDAAVAKNPAGLAISLPAADAERASIQAAVAKGIPVITYNSGVDDFKSVGAIAHVGSIEYDAGYATGLRLHDLGARNIICSNAVPQNIATTTRCKAISEAMASKGDGKAEQFVGDLNDPAAEKNIIAAKLQADPTIDAVVGIGVPFTISACIQIQQEQNLQGKLHCATFDTFKDAVDGIKSGTVDFAVAQQPFLQGYLPIQMLTMFLTYHVLPGGATAVIPTGPFFVDNTNVTAIDQSAANGTF